MNQTLRILMVEDSGDDANLLLHVLRREGYELISKVVDTPSAMRAALESQDWDVITSDHSMPYFNAPEALALAKELRPDVPFIIVSGEIDINLAVSLMKQGAHDYIQKRELSLLVPAIERELHEAEMHREYQTERTRIEEDLRTHQIELEMQNEELRRAKVELEATQARYFDLYDLAPVGYLTLSEHGLILESNLTATSLLGVTRDELVKTPFSRFITEEDHAIYYRYRKLLFETGEPQAYELRLLKKDRATFWVRMDVTAALEVNGTLVSRVVMSDITVSKQASEEISKLNEELEQRILIRTASLESSNRDLEDFAHAVSHNLRAPLRSIDGFSQVLLEDYQEALDEAGKNCLERVRKATQKMFSMMDNLLKLSRVNRLDFNIESVDLSQMVRAIAVAKQQSKPDRAVDMTIQEGITVQGSCHLLKIILQNLIDNAWKFTGKEAHPRIEFGKMIKDGEDICFIRDNGIGFNMDYADNLFRPFHRLHKADEFPGIGTGLAAVKRIMNRHGGKVWAEAKINEGATFYFSLPSTYIN